MKRFYNKKNKGVVHSKIQRLLETKPLDYLLTRREILDHLDGDSDFNFTYNDTTVDVITKKMIQDGQLESIEGSYKILKHF